MSLFYTFKCKINCLEAFVIGDRDNDRSNTRRITYAGAVIGKAAYASSGADYAEYFEWLDGNLNNEDRVFCCYGR